MKKELKMPKTKFEAIVFLYAYFSLLKQIN